MIVIRRAESTDVPSVKELELLSGLAPWGESDYRAETSRDGSCFLVASEQGTDCLLGFISVRLITIINQAEDLPNTDSEAEILNLAAHPSARRIGIATALLKAVAGLLPVDHQCRLFLEVRASNKGAAAFYRSIGFRETGIRPDFYSNPRENAMLMACEKDKLLARNPPDGLVFEL